MDTENPINVFRMRHIFEEAFPPLIGEQVVWVPDTLRFRTEDPVLDANKMLSRSDIAKVVYTGFKFEGPASRGSRFAPNYKEGLRSEIESVYAPSYYSPLKSNYPSYLDTVIVLSHLLSVINQEYRDHLGLVRNLAPDHYDAVALHSSHHTWGHSYSGLFPFTFFVRPFVKPIYLGD